MAAKSTLTFVALFVAAIYPSAFAQGSVQPSEQGQAKSPVNLLPGYKIQIFPGLDSAAGRIWKDGGLEIEIEMCCGFGNAADSVPKSRLAWREQQTTHGQLVVLVFTKANELIVSYPKLVTNFRTKTRNSRDLAEALLIALSYDETQGYPVDPKAVAPPAPSKP